VTGVLVFVLLLLMGYGLSLALEGRIVVTGLRIRDLREQRATLERSIADLTAQLATATSYEVMAERARALGYRPARAEEIVFVPATGYQPAAFVPSQSAQLPVGLDPDFFPPSYYETWLDRVHWPWAGGRP